MATSRIKKGRLNHSQRIAPYLFILPAMLLTAVLMLYPIFYSLYLSFHKYMLNVPVDRMAFNGLDNYKYIFTNEEFLYSLKWTLIFTVVVVSLELIFGMLLALFLNNKAVKKRAVPFRTLLFLPMMISPIITGVMWRVLFEAKFGPINYLLNCLGFSSVNWLAEETPAKIALITTDVWHYTAFVMLVFLAALQTVPEELYEAAMVEGANGFQTFFKITLPYLRNFVALIVSVRLMDALRFFDEIFVLTKGGPGISTQTAGFTVYRLAFRYSDAGAGSAGAFVFLILIAAVSLLSMFLIKGRSKD